MSFFIRSEDRSVTLEMDATIAHTHTQLGTPTSYAVESGRKKSDHYIQEMDTFSYSGVVSDVKYANRLEVTKSVADFEVAITALKKSGQVFTCSFSSALGEFKNCLFTSLSVNQLPEHGKYARGVEFSITQVEVADQAEVEESPVPSTAFIDPSEKKGNNSTSPKTLEDKEREKADSIWTLNKKFLAKFFSGTEPV
jgi:hypothetical protein